MTGLGVIDVLSITVRIVAQLFALMNHFSIIFFLRRMALQPAITIGYTGRALPLPHPDPPAAGLQTMDGLDVAHRRGGLETELEAAHLFSGPREARTEVAGLRHDHLANISPRNGDAAPPHGK